MPARVANSKPTSFRRSAKITVALLPASPVDEIDQVAELLLLHRAIDFAERHRGRHDLIKQHAADGSLDALGRAIDVVGRAAAAGRCGRPSSSSSWRAAVDRHPHRDPRVQIDLAVVVRDAHFAGRREDLALALRERLFAGHVVEPEHDVLGRHDDRLAARRREDVVGGHHQHARLDLRLDRQRHVHRHLVAVEVRVVGDADQRMELNGLALDQHRLEGLDAQADAASARGSAAPDARGSPRRGCPRPPCPPSRPSSWRS